MSQPKGNFFDRNKRKSALAALLLFLRQRKAVALLLVAVLFGSFLFVSPAMFLRIPGSERVYASVSWMAGRLGLDLSRWGLKDGKHSYDDLLALFRAARGGGSGRAGSGLAGGAGGAGAGAGSIGYVLGRRADLDGAGDADGAGGGKAGKGKRGVKGYLSPDDSESRGDGSYVPIDPEDLAGEREGMVRSAFAGGFFNNRLGGEGFGALRSGGGLGPSAGTSGGQFAGRAGGGPVSGDSGRSGSSGSSGQSGSSGASGASGQSGRSGLSGGAYASRTLLSDGSGRAISGGVSARTLGHTASGASGVTGYGPSGTTPGFAGQLSGAIGTAGSNGGQVGGISFDFGGMGQQAFAQLQQGNILTGMATSPNCQAGSCPGEFSYTHAGGVYDGWHLDTDLDSFLLTGIPEFDGTGAPQFPQAPTIAAALQQAAQTRTDMQLCEDARARFYAPQQSLQLDQERLSREFEDRNCGRGSCSRSKIRTCRDLGSQMRNKCVARMQLRCQELAACPITRGNPCSSDECNGGGATGRELLDIRINSNGTEIRTMDGSGDDGGGLCCEEDGTGCRACDPNEE